MSLSAIKKGCFHYLYYFYEWALKRMYYPSIVSVIITYKADFFDIVEFVGQAGSPILLFTRLTLTMKTY